MIAILIPVLLAVFLGPGVGQIYNREFKKGSIMLGAGLALLLFFSVWLSRAALVYLPTDLTTVDKEVLRQIIQDHIIKDHPGTFYTYQILLAALWVYGVVDAYIGASRRRASATETP